MSSCELMKRYQACMHDYSHACQNAVYINPQCELCLRTSKLSQPSAIMLGKLDCLDWLIAVL